jgi:hypothetical protein
MRSLASPRAISEDGTHIDSSRSTILLRAMYEQALTLFSRMSYDSTLATTTVPLSRIVGCFMGTLGVRTIVSSSGIQTISLPSANTKELIPKTTTIHTIAEKFESIEKSREMVDSKEVKSNKHCLQ